MKHQNGSEVITGAILNCPCEDNRARRVTLNGTPHDTHIAGYIQVSRACKVFTVSGVVLFVPHVGYTFVANKQCRNYGKMSEGK